MIDHQGMNAVSHITKHIHWWLEQPVGFNATASQLHFEQSLCIFVVSRIASPTIVCGLHMAKLLEGKTSFAWSTQWRTQQWENGRINMNCYFFQGDLRIVSIINWDLNMERAFSKDLLCSQSLDAARLTIFHPLRFAPHLGKNLRNSLQSRSVQSSTHPAMLSEANTFNSAESSHYILILMPHFLLLTFFWPLMLAHVGSTFAFCDSYAVVAGHDPWWHGISRVLIPACDREGTFGLGVFGLRGFGAFWGFGMACKEAFYADWSLCVQRSASDMIASVSWAQRVKQLGQMDRQQILPALQVHSLIKSHQVVWISSTRSFGPQKPRNHLFVGDTRVPSQFNGYKWRFPEIGNYP